MRALVVIAMSIVALLTSMTTTVHADTWQCCNRNIRWFTNSVTWKMTTNWSLDRKQVIQDVAARWREINGVAFRGSIVNDDDATIDPAPGGDGNEIGWLPDNAPPPDKVGAIAITIVTYRKCNSGCTVFGAIQNADIYVWGRDAVYDDSGRIVSSTQRNWILWPPIMNHALGYTDFTLSSVMSHELGHAFGLQHTPSGFSRLESHMPSGGGFHSGVAQNLRVTPLAQETLDMRVLYPQSSFVSAPQISAVQTQNNWAMSEPPGTLNTVPQSIPLSWCSGAGICTTQSLPNDGDMRWFFPRNRVIRNGSTKNMKPGDKVDIRVCAQNRGVGLFSQVMPVKVYFSADPTITSGDFITPDGHTFPSLAGGTATCKDLLITVPLVPSGLYSIGYVLDTSRGVDAQTTDNANIINSLVFVLPP